MGASKLHSDHPGGAWWEQRARSECLEQARSSRVRVLGKRIGLSEETRWRLS